MLKTLAYLSLFIVFLLASLWFVTTQPVFRSKGETEPGLKADPAILQSIVYHLSEELPPRSGTTQNLDQSAAYIYKGLSQFSDDVSYQGFEINGEQYKNVIARFGTPAPHCGVVVIGAHYDVFGGHPGADDNASGVAGILELARLFAKTEINCGIELVAYSMEEIVNSRKYMGSYHHAQRLTQDSVKFEWMISLEMIGYFSDEPGSQRYPLSVLKNIYPDTGNFIALVGDFNQIKITRFIKAAFKTATGLPIYSINTSRRIPGITWSDHASYWQFGLPALMITDTSYNRNPHYHGTNDTWETLDYPRMAEVVNGVFNATLLYIMSKQP